MKSAPTTISNESAPDQRNYTVGRLPASRNTVTSAVLADLLESKVLTGMDGIFNQGTTRLSAVVHSLERNHGWTVERRTVATGTKDGRVALIAAYWLSPIIIEQAFATGARDWVDGVKAVRTKQREQANMCEDFAARINACLRRSSEEVPRRGGPGADL